MQQIKVGGDFDLSLEAFLEGMRDPALFEFLAAQQGLAERRFSGFREEGPLRRWEVELTLLEQVPAFARPFIDLDRLRWVQKFTMDTRTNIFQLEVEHPLPAQLLAARGEGRILSPASGKSRLELDLSLESRMPLIGGRIEAHAAARTRVLLERDLEMRRVWFTQYQGR